MNARTLLRFMVICFYIQLVQMSNAQSSIIDSLQQQLEITNTDTAKLKIYIRLLSISKVEENNTFYRTAIKLANRIEDKYWQYSVYYTQALSSFSENNFDDAIILLDNITINVYEDENKLLKLFADVEILKTDIFQMIGQFEKSKEHALIAKKIYQNLEDFEGIAKSFYSLSINARHHGNFDLSLTYADSAMSFLDTTNLNLYGTILNVKGRTFRSLSNYDSAGLYYSKALDISIEGKNRSNQSAMLNNLGNIEHSRGNLTKALDYYLNSLEIKNELKNNRGVALAHHNIGAVRMDLRAFNLAKRDFEKSLNLSESYDYKVLSIHNFQRIGTCLVMQNDLNQALDYHKKALKAAESIDYKSGIIEARINLAKDEQKQKNYSQSIDHLLKAIELSEKINDKILLGQALTSLAETYVLIQEVEDNEFKINLSEIQIGDIEELFIRGLELAKESGNYIGLQSSLSALRNYYHKTQQFKKESNISIQYIQFRDSLFNQQSAKSISEWETKYETFEKEKEIELLQKENELYSLKSSATKKNYLFALIVLFFVAALGFMLLYYHNKNRRINQLAELRKKISGDLHDDVGSLLTGLAMRSELLELKANKTEKASLRQIHEMSRLAMSRIRDAVWAMDDTKDNSEALIDRMKNHAEMYISSSDKSYVFDFKSKNVKRLLPTVRQHVLLIFKETITNILKHSNGNTINISLRFKKNNLIIKIHDNGTSSGLNNIGQGIKSMQRRAEKINGQFSINNQDGFLTQLIVPL